MSRSTGSWVYAVFWHDLVSGKPMWAMSLNKKRAIKFSKAHPGSDVSRISYGHSDLWDAPTFRAVGECIHRTPTNVLVQP